MLGENCDGGIITVALSLQDRLGKLIAILKD